MIFQDEPGDKETEPSHLCDAELDDETIGKALPSPLFASSVIFRTLKNGETCARTASREMENETIRILLERQKEQINYQNKIGIFVKLM